MNAAAGSSASGAVEPWTIGRVLTWSTDFLRERGLVDSPRLDAELLLAHTLGFSRIQLYTHFDQPLSPAERDPFKTLLKRRSAHEPVAYLTGSKEFMGFSFGVTPAVLIPRPDTETLVEHVLAVVKAAPRSEPWRLLDVGTGSGCIAISLGLKNPRGRRRSLGLRAVRARRRPAPTPPPSTPPFHGSNSTPSPRPPGSVACLLSRAVAANTPLWLLSRCVEAKAPLWLLSRCVEAKAPLCLLRGGVGGNAPRLPVSISSYPILLTSAPLRPPLSLSPCVPSSPLQRSSPLPMASPFTALSPPAPRSA